LVQVKGKTQGKRVFWPVRESELDPGLAEEFDSFSEGLELYYAGSWAKASVAWERVKLPLVEVFRDRVAGREAPADWNGVWAMTTK
jgi:adenylate cyclase